MKLNGKTLTPVFATWLSVWGSADALQVDSSGDAVVLGVDGAQARSNSFMPDGDKSLLRIDPQGRTVRYVSGLPGALRAAAMNQSNGDIWLAGQAYRSIPTTTDGFQRELQGEDGYLIRIGPKDVNCQYSVSPTSLAIGALPASGTVAVKAPAGCAWSVSGQPDWLRAEGVGVGPGTLRYDSLVNEVAAAREGVLRVGGVNVPVTQAGSTCVYALASTGAVVPATGGTVDLAVATTPGCPWTASFSLPSFVTFATPPGMTGSGIVWIQVPSHRGVQRHKTITVAAQPFTITQKAAPCAAAWTPAIIQAPAAGGAFVARAAVSRTCPVNIVSPVSWVSAGAGGQPETFLVQVSPNTGIIRTAQLYTDSPLFVQQAPAGGCSFGVGAATASAGASGGTGEVAVTASSGTCAWNAASGAAWLQVYPLSGTSTGSVRYTALPNFTGLARSAMVSVSGQTFTVSQPAGTGTANERFVQSVYFGAFGRMPSPAEVAFQLQGGTPGAALVNAFLASNEFAAGAKFVAGLYVGLLGRDAEYGGWQFQRDALVRADVSPHGLVGNFLGGAEYAARFGAPDNAGFVRLLYRNILGREATAEEVAFHAAGITGSAGRTNLAVTFLGSEEFRRRTGPRLTAFLLHSILWRRGPSEWELDQQADKIAAGTPLTTLIQEMLAAQ